MAGDALSARMIYEKALTIDKDRRDIQQRYELAEKTMPAEESIAGGFPPLHAQAVNRLAEKLTGKSLAVDEEQVRRAAELLEKTVHSDSPASSVSDHLEEIDALLPAILELNIRQARAQGRADLAADLVELQRGLLANQATMPDTGMPSADGRITVVPESKAIRAVLIGESSAYSPLRLSVIKAAMGKAGIVVEDRWEEIPLPWEGYDIVVAHNPHNNPVFMKALAAWAGMGNPVLVDMDTDFRKQISTRPEIKQQLKDSGQDPRAFTAALQLADVLTFPSTQLALSFSDEGYQALTMPDGWSEKNSLWTKNTPPSSKLNIGLFTEPGNLESAVSIRRVVIRILREFPQTRLIVSGDPEVYQLFETIPDTRRIYIPPSEPEDYPYLLAQADIHLIPYTENEAIHPNGDRRYMEIGVRKATWIGSPTAAAEEWNAGGLIARSGDDWYTHLKTLIQESESRIRLAQQGYDKARNREAANLSNMWESAIKKALKMNKPKSLLRGEK